MELLLLIGTLGLVCGFLSGLLGIGGGIIMAPLLLFVPPLCGFAELPMRVVAGLTIVQGLVACLAGVSAHYKFNHVSGRLAGWGLHRRGMIFARCCRLRFGAMRVCRQRRCWRG